MATTLQAWIKANPGVNVAGDSGRWLVAFCGRTFRAQRFENFYAAQKAAHEACTVCADGKSHRLIELEPALAAPVKVVKRFRELGWE